MVTRQEHERCFVPREKKLVRVRGYGVVSRVRPGSAPSAQGGAPFPFCSACYTVTAQYLLDQRIPACEPVTVGLATPAQPPAPVPGRTGRNGEEPATADAAAAGGGR